MKKQLFLLFLIFLSNKLSYTQISPYVVCSNKGNFLITWQNIGGNSTFAQHFDENGKKIGSSFLIKSNKVLLNSDGTYSCFWTNNKDHDDLQFQMFSKDGSELSNISTIYSSNTNTAGRFAISEEVNNKIAILWECNNPEQLGIRVITNEGVSVGYNQQVTDQFAKLVDHPDVCLAKNGVALAVWEDTRLNNGARVFGQLIDEDGILIGSNFRIDNCDYGLEGQHVASIDSSFMVVWHDDDIGRIYGRILNTKGEFLTDVFYIYSDDIDSYHIQQLYVEAKNDKYFVFVGHGGDTSPKIREFDSSGNALTPVYDIVYSNTEIHESAFCVDNDEQIIFVWAESVDSYNTIDIYAKIMQNEVFSDLLINIHLFKYYSFPLPNAQNQPLDQNIEITYGYPLDLFAKNGENIVVQGSKRGLYDFNIAYNESNNKITIDPIMEYFPDEKITVTLIKLNEDDDLGGYTWQFKTKSLGGSGQFKKIDDYNFRGRLAKCGDFNNDSHLDILAGYLYFGDGKGKFIVNSVEDADNYCTIADFDLNGNLDFACSNGVNISYGNGKGNFPLVKNYNIVEDGEAIASNDINGDGYFDIIVSDLSKKTVYIFTNNSDNNFTKIKEYNYSEQIRMVKIFDYNNDGYMDWGALTESAGKLILYEGHGNGNFSDGPTLGISNFAFDFTASDLDNDNFLDLAITDRSNNKIIIYKNLKNGFFSEIGAYSVDDNVVCIRSADLDSDGDEDIIVGNHYANNISVLFNDGLAFFDNRKDYFTGDGPWGLDCGDFDEDGDVDIAVMNSGSSTLSIFMNQNSAADILVSTDTLNFGQRNLYQKRTLQFIVYNHAIDTSLIISQFEVSDSSFSIHPSQASILPGDSTIFIADFIPQTIKDYNEVLTIHSNDPYDPEKTIVLTGKGVSPPSVTTDTTLFITENSASLNATINPNGKSTTVKFQYGYSTAYGNEINAEPYELIGSTNIEVSADISNLSTYTEYHYRAVATNEYGTKNGNDRTFRTAPTLPIAVTSAPQNIDSTSAVLIGIVNANGLETEVVFEYGISDKYGNEIAAQQSPVSGGQDAPVSVLLTELSNNTTYHYRIKAFNSVGSVVGEDQSFTTTSVSAKVTTHSATLVTTSSAKLHGEVNPYGLNTQVKFLYGPDTNYGNEITASPNPVLGTDYVPVTANLTGLIPNINYQFCLEATNTAGTVRGENQSFSTSASAPAVITLQPSDIDTNSVTLKGSINPKGQSTEVKFEYGTTTAYGLEISAEESPVLGTSETEVSARLAGLSQNTVYHYRVVATNPSGTMTGSNQSFIPSISKPSAQTLPVTSLSMTGARAHGLVNPKGREAIVKFQYSQDLSFNQEVTADESPITGAEDVPVSATLSGLQSDATYYIRVMATNGIDSTYAPGQTFTTLRDNQLPTIAPIAVGNATSNQSQTISAILSDNVGIQIAYLKYRQGGAAHYDSTQMSWIGGDNYESTIPSSKVTERGLEYFIAVDDSAGNRATYPKNDTENNPRILRVSNSNLPFGSSHLGQVYRMIAVPFDLDNPSINNVLADDLGSYNIKNWRLFKHVDGKDVEFGTSGFSTFEPGTGFWLISKESTTLDAGSGKSVLTSEPYVITLSPGWNQIGNPFAFPIAWEDVTKDEVIESQLVGYSGSVNDASGYDYTKTILEPWEGYFVNNTSNDDVYITIPAREAGSMAKTLPNEILSTLSESEWGVQLKVISPKYFDKDNYIGCLKDASEGFDENDFSEAPLLQHHLSLSFEDNLTADFRPITTVGYTWNTMIRGTKDQSITLSIEQMKHFPEDWQLVLLDETCQIRIDLKNRMSYRTILSNSEQNYQILAGTEDYIEANDQGYKGTPTAFKLNQNYPNPFNPTTKISYELPEQSDIRILVFNMLGQQVTTLLNQTQSAGRYDILWNGMDENSNHVSGGMYFVMMQAGGYREVKKMVLVR